MDEPLLHLTGLSKTYGTTVAVDGVDLTVEPGQIVALLGPNGAGKTTTIKMLMGQLQPSRGTARIAGLDCFSQRAETMKVVGYLPDEPTFHEYLTGRELLRFVGGLHGLDGATLGRESARWVDVMDLGEAIDDYAANYSKGMKKKLALALALLHRPRLLILDEPANGLDPYATRTLLEVVAAQAAAGVAILFSTHLIDQAEKLCHRAAIIARGKLVACGPVQELRAQAADGGSLEQAFFALTAPGTPA